MGLKKFEENKEISLESNESVEDSKEVEVEKKVEKKKVNEPLTTSEEDLVKEINASREIYKEEAKKQKKLNYITTAAMIVVLIGAFILVWANSELTYLTYIGFGIMGICLVGSYFLTQKYKKVLSKKAEGYIQELFQKQSSFLFNDKENKNLEVDSLGKIDDKVFFDAHFYAGLKGTRSRNIAKFERDGAKYVACDMAANTLLKGRLSPKFLGKFYSVEFEGNYDHTIVLQLKGGNLSVRVDDTEGLECANETDSYVVYSDDKEYKKVLDSRVLGLIKKIEVGELIVDALVSIRGNKICIGIDYIDNFLNIPVDIDFSIEYTRQEKQDFAKVVKIVDQIVKNINSTTAENK